MRTPPAYCRQRCRRTEYMVSNGSRGYTISFYFARVFITSQKLQIVRVLKLSRIGGISTILLPNCWAVILSTCPEFGVILRNAHVPVSFLVINHQISVSRILEIGLKITKALIPNSYSIYNKYLQDKISSGTKVFHTQPLSNILRPIHFMCLTHLCPFYWHGLILIPVWISNHMPCKV